MSFVRDLLRSADNSLAIVRLRIYRRIGRFWKHWERRQMVLEVRARTEARADATRISAQAEAYAIRKHAEAEAQERKILGLAQARVVKQRARRMQQRLRRERWRRVRASCSASVRAVSSQAMVLFRMARRGLTASTHSLKERISRLFGRLAQWRRTLAARTRSFANAVAFRTRAGAQRLRRGIAWSLRKSAQGVKAFWQGTRRRAANGRIWLAKSRTKFRRRVKRWVADGRSWVTNTLANLFVLLAVMFTIVGLVGVAFKNPWLATLPFWLTVVSGRAANLSRRSLLKQSWKWAVYPRMSTVIIGSWLILLIFQFLE